MTINDVDKIVRRFEASHSATQRRILARYVEIAALGQRVVETRRTATLIELEGAIANLADALGMSESPPAKT